MASISNETNGGKVVQFVDADGKRRSIRLGKVTKKVAGEIKLKVETLAAAKAAKLPLDGETARWVGSLGDVLANRLAAVGLIEKRDECVPVSLVQFIGSVINGWTDTKPATREVWRQSLNAMKEFFGEDCDLRTITSVAAEEFKSDLAGKDYAAATVAKRLRNARSFVQVAVRRGLLSRNPFEGVSYVAGVRNVKSFVTRDVVTGIMQTCPDHHWRCIVALCRFGGLRCPSEVLSLRWSDIDWERGRMIVRSPKLEHLPGKDQRVVPLFPELVEPLRESFELAPVGSTYVIDERYRLAALGRSGWKNCNLRTTFEKIVRRAGLQPWARLFNALRASRATELAERFPSHVAAAWLGHSPAIAETNYRMVTQEHFEKAATLAARPSSNALQNPVQQPAETNCIVEKEAEVANYLARCLPSLASPRQTDHVARRSRLDSNQQPSAPEADALSN